MDLSEEYLLELFEKHLKGVLSTSEREKLQHAARQDEKVSEMLTFLESTPLSSKEHIEAEIIYQNSRPNSLEYIPKEESPTRIRPYLKYSIAVAAAVILLFFAWTFWSTTDLEDEADVWEIVRAEKGERKFFKLVDGTEIWLNNDSELKVKAGYGTKHRNIKLVGEAYFSVAKNKKLPLHVYTKEASIEVLGTVFNVRSYPNDHKTETSLVEGKVKLNAVDGSAKEYVMSPGDRVTVAHKEITADRNVNKSEIEAVGLQVVYKKMNASNKDALELKWIENKLVFNADPLDVVVEKLSRWYNRHIIIDKEKHCEKKFTGLFQEKDCEDVLDYLNQTGGKIKYTVKNDTIYIR